MQAIGRWPHRASSFAGAAEGAVAADPARRTTAAADAVLQVVLRAITRLPPGQSWLKAGHNDGGAVTLIQRFGSTATLNPQLATRKSAFAGPFAPADRGVTTPLRVMPDDPHR